VAYQRVNELHGQLCAIEKEAAALNRLQRLFELPVVEYTHLRDCRQELVWLKQTWDLVGFVDSVFAEWKRVPWQYANTEFLEDETKRFLILTKQLNKAVREWDVYLM
jgi:dynein heavy chain